MIKRLARNPLFWGAGALAVAVGLYLALGVFGVQTLFYNSEVNEEFEVRASPSPATPSEPEPSPGAAEDGAEPTGPVAVSSGEFHPVAHPGSGVATVYRMEDGSHVLRLENLDIFNGPALYVYAVAASDANDDATVLDAGFVDAGPLKGNQGNQTYELPAGFDPETYRSISVWCETFSVNFATAPLQ